MKFADLHLHTKASDGTDGLKERVRDAGAKGLSCIAITDHDIINPDLEKPVSFVDGVEVISGAELDVEVQGFKVDLLAYFVSRADDEIVEVVDDLYEKRRERMKEMVNRVNEVIDSEILFEEVENITDGIIVRSHLGKVLIEKGEAKDMDDALDNIISYDSYSYVPVERPSPGRLIELIHENGGVVSLAHPGRDIPPEKFDDVVSVLVDQGLDAIETDYYYKRFQKTSKQIYFGNGLAREMSEKYGLLRTGGSDCHGYKSDFYGIGKVKIGYERVEELKERRKRYI